MSTYVPPQHGAWAFLALPLVLGFIVAPWTPLLLVLAIAWIATYPLSYAALGLVRAKRPQRFRAPFLIWSAVVLPAVACCWCVVHGCCGLESPTQRCSPSISATPGETKNEPSPMTSSLLSSAPRWSLSHGRLESADQSWTPPSLGSVPDDVWALVAVCALVLLGSTLHVKSLIRERRDRRYARASLVVASASVPAAVALAVWWGWPSGVWLIVPFIVLVLRAFAVPRRSMRPGAIGMVELACFVLVAASAALAAA